MTQTAEEPDPRELLEGGRELELPAELLEDLREDFFRAIAMDRTREPLVVSCGKLPLPDRLGRAHPHLLVCGLTPTQEGGVGRRELKIERDAGEGQPAVLPAHLRLVHWLRENLPSAEAGDPPRFLTAAVFETLTGTMSLRTWIGEESARRLSRAGTFAVVEAIALERFEAASSAGNPFIPVQVGPVAELAGDWELTGYHESAPLREGDGKAFDDRARTWLLSGELRLPELEWTPTHGSRVRISPEGRLQERVHRDADAAVSSWGGDGRRRRGPTPLDAQLTDEGSSWRLRSRGSQEDQVDGFGADHRLVEQWRTAADGALIRHVRAFVPFPAGRALESFWSRYERADDPAPEGMFSQPAPEPPLPQPAQLPGRWRLRAYCEEPQLVQSKDDAWSDRRRFWYSPLVTEISGRGWRSASELELTIGADGTVTERVTGTSEIPWISEDVVLEPRPVPYSGRVVSRPYEGRFRIIPDGVQTDGNGCWRTEDCQTNDALFPRCDGTLVRVKSASMENGYAQLRLHLLYERVDDAAESGEGARADEGEA